MAEDLTVRVENLEGRATKSEDDIVKLKEGFPGGDIEAHRRYHESIIERTSEIRRLRIAIQEKTISGLVWTAIVAGGMMIWNAIKDHLK